MCQLPCWTEDTEQQWFINAQNLVVHNLPAHNLRNCLKLNSQEMEINFTVSATIFFVKTLYEMTSCSSH